MKLYSWLSSHLHLPFLFQTISLSCFSIQVETYVPISFFHLFLCVFHKSWHQCLWCLLLCCFCWEIPQPGWDFVIRWRQFNVTEWASSSWVNGKNVPHCDEPFALLSLWLDMNWLLRLAIFGELLHRMRIIPWVLNTSIVYFQVFHLMVSLFVLWCALITSEIVGFLDFQRILGILRAFH